MRALLALLVACGGSQVAPSAETPLAPHGEARIGAISKDRHRMVPPEAFLRAYLVWFGGLTPVEVQKRARGWNLFEDWRMYLATLGLPDYAIDVPRTTESNTMMLATIGRLGEVLCIRAAERDLHPSTPLEARSVYAFDRTPTPTREDFVERFDVLHRTFLSYPAELASDQRVERYWGLYQSVANAPHPNARLPADSLAWAAVCTALVLHPEAELY